MVGASYRVYDAYDPKLREGAISPKPEVVIKREGISLGLAWMFGLCTATVNNSISRKLGLQDKSLLVSFFTIAIANAMAEGVSRLISYQGLSAKNAGSPLNLLQSTINPSFPGSFRPHASQACISSGGYPFLTPVR